MTILALMVWMAIIGLIAWLLVTYVPMPQQIKGLIIAAAVIICVLMIIQAIGLLGPLNQPVPRVR